MMGEDEEMVVEGIFPRYESVADVLYVFLEISGESAEFGEINVSIEVEYTGPEVKIGFNPEFLLSPLRNLTKDEVFFEFKDEMSPGVFKTLDNFLCVVMPLRI